MWSLFKTILLSHDARPIYKCCSISYRYYLFENNKMWMKGERPACIPCSQRVNTPKVVCSFLPRPFKNRSVHFDYLNLNGNFKGDIMNKKHTIVDATKSTADKFGRKNEILGAIETKRKTKTWSDKQMK